MIYKLIYPNIKIFLFVLALFYANSIYAQNFTTAFGFEFSLSEKWKKYPKEKVKLNKSKSLDAQGEIYYLTDNVKRNFVDNIYISYLDANKLSGALMAIDDQKLKVFCKDWSSEIKKAALNIDVSAKTQFKLDKCMFLPLKNHKHKGLYISYKLTNKIGQMQYFVLSKQKNFLITATYALEKATKIDRAFKALINSIKFTNSQKPLATTAKNSNSTNN